MEVYSLFWFCARVLDITARCLVTAVLYVTVLVAACVCIPLYCSVLYVGGLTPVQAQPLVRFLARVIIHACGQRFRVEGEYPDLEHGPPLLYILLPHTSLLDAIILGAALKGHFTAVMAIEYFSIWFWGTMMRLHDVEPIDRGNPETAIARLNAAAERAFNKGRSLAMFIQKTRTKEGGIDDLRSGPYYIARANGVRVVLVVIKGAATAVPKGLGWIKPDKIVVTFSRVISPGEISELDSDGFKKLVQKEAGAILNN
ncbi:MAG: lysophospholipid acyltransferase family protein [Patescibacteria group bacterium]